MWIAVGPIALEYVAVWTATERVIQSRKPRFLIQPPMTTRSVLEHSDE
jgi:hypothetical protein